MPEEQVLAYTDNGAVPAKHGPWVTILGRYHGYVIMGKGNSKQAYIVFDEIKGPRYYLHVTPLGFLFFRATTQWYGEPYKVSGWMVPIPQRFANQMGAREALFARKVWGGVSLRKGNRGEEQ